MRKPYLLLLTAVLLFAGFFVKAQTVSLFSAAGETDKQLNRRQLTADASAIQNLLAAKPGATVLLSIPSLTGAAPVTLELQPYSIYTNDFKVVTSESNGAAVAYQQKHFYAGKMAGYPQSLVMLSIDAKQNCFVYMNDGTQAWIVKGMENNAGSYMLYKEDKPVAMDLFKGDDIAKMPALKTKQFSAPTGTANLAPQNKCVGIYTECIDQYYIRLGSVQAVGDCVGDLFAIVSILYANQGIPIKISELFVWTTTDPYGGIFESLPIFVAQRPVYNGNIAQLLFDGAGGGGIAYLTPPNCKNTPGINYSTAGVGISANPYPTYSGGIMVYAHEMGHNFGSPHTHDCAWRGYRLDNCGPSGPCAAPVVYPGTIMSYCGGYSFTNGFGRLPGNLMRDNYLSIPGSCLYSCTFIPIPPGCAPIPQNLTLQSIGDTAILVSWDANGTDTFAVDYQKDGDAYPSTIYTTSTSTLIQGVTYCSNYVVRVQGMCGINAGYFSPFQKITTGPPPPLCKSFGESTGQGWIESVQVNNIVLQTGNNEGRLLSCDHFSVAYGGLTYLELTPGPLPAYTPMYWRVWVDVNQDGVFDNAESIYTSPVATTGKVYANVYVPGVPFIIGNKVPKIKIAMKAGDIPESCEVFPYGEVEEYLVDFGYSDVSCRSRGESDANQWIARVQVANLDNSSGASGGYTDFSSTTPLIALKKDTTYVMQITSGRAFAQGRRLFYRAWFDFNHNGTFESSELVLDRYALQLSTVSQSFSVPSSTNANQKFAVRVAVKYMSPPEICEIFPEGEVEDYMAIVVDTTIHHKQVYTEERTPLDKMVSLYPIPARNQVIVDISSEKEQRIQIQVMNNKGVVLKTINGISLQKGNQRLPVNITHYWPGIYFIKVIAASGDVAVKKFVVI